MTQLQITSPARTANLLTIRLFSVQNPISASSPMLTAELVPSQSFLAQMAFHLPNSCPPNLVAPYLPTCRYREPLLQAGALVIATQATRAAPLSSHVVFQVPGSAHL